jgi:hypothetical protein
MVHMPWSWPLSGRPPLLFVLTVEALNTMFSLADMLGLLTSLWSPSIHHTVLLYVDDLVIFVAPVEHDICIIHAILDIFVDASGLCTNIGKCQITPIRCSP